MPTGTPGTGDLEPAAHHRWESALHGLRADALDCLQTTLALVADHAHGAGTHLALGCRWRFPVRQRDGVIRVQPSLQDRLDEAVELLGLRVEGPDGPVDGPALRRRVAAGGAVYVVADAYGLPWIPYAGRRHMPHSFLLEVGAGGYTVVDAYHNDTRWGPARPGAWTLSAAGVDRAVSDGALAVAVEAAARRPPPDTASVLAANAARARAAAPDIERYAAVLRAGLHRPEVVERLVLDIWQLTRERLLHGVWLGAHPAAAEVAARAEAWQRLATQSYLALRRAERGMPLNGAVVDDITRLLHADAELVARLEEPAPAGGRGPVLGAVLDALRDTLPVDDVALSEAATLRALPGFNSFRLVDIIDRVERRLGVQLPAEVTADDLQDVEGLCRLFARAVANRSGG